MLLGATEPTAERAAPASHTVPPSAAPARAALGQAALGQAERERDAAYAARDAAEDARAGAEAARSWAEAAGHVARADVALLGEEVAFLREQLRGDRAYQAEVVEPELTTLYAERESLLQELAVLDDELQARAVRGGEHNAGTPRAR